MHGPKEQDRHGGVGGHPVGDPAHVPGHFAGAVGAQGDEVVVLVPGEGHDFPGRHAVHTGPIDLQTLVLEFLPGLGQEGGTEFLFLGRFRPDRARGASPAKAPTPL